MFVRLDRLTQMVIENCDTGEEMQSLNLCLYEPDCSDPPLVRGFLNSDGEIQLNMEEEHDRFLGSLEDDALHRFIILAVSAMAFGCRVWESHLDLLKKIYDQTPQLHAKGRSQLHKALFGPDGFQNGKPYDFGFKPRSASEHAQIANTLFNSSEVNSATDGNDLDEYAQYERDKILRSPVIAQLRKEFDFKHCRYCYTDEPRRGRNLRECGACHEVAYCSLSCQRRDWKHHKKQCVPVKD